MALKLLPRHLAAWSNVLFMSGCPLAIRPGLSYFTPGLHPTSFLSTELIFLRSYARDDDDNHDDITRSFAGIQARASGRFV